MQPNTHRVSLLKVYKLLVCLVEECQEREVISTNLRVHKVQRHMLDTVVILEEGNFPHPRCTRCNMFVPWVALNGRHPDTEFFSKGSERK